MGEGLNEALLDVGSEKFLGMMSDEGVRRKLAQKKERVQKLREAQKTLKGLFT